MSLNDDIDKLLSSPERIEDLINLIADDPNALDRLAASKQSAAAFATLLPLIEGEIDNRSMDDLDRFIHERLEPCLRLRVSTGKIMAANARAGALLSAKPQMPFSDLEIWPINGEELIDQITRLVADAADGPRHLASRAEVGLLETLVPYVLIAIPPHDGPDERDVLLLLGHRPEQTSQQHRLFRAHDLSPSEVEITQEFMAGRSLQEIATARGRSLATVRKQFYTICEKFGVTSQADLLRVIYQDVRLMSDVRPMIEKSERPDRIEASILRPGGRTVEVIVAGDPAGYPVILIPSPSLRSWPPATERAFRKAGLQCISIVSPGFGKTSPAPPDTRRMQCATEDALAVMDQLGLGQAAILGANFSLRAALSYAALAPERFSQVIVPAPNIPRAQLVTHKTKISILSTVQRLFSHSLDRTDLAVMVAGRTFRAMSPDAAIRLIHRGSPAAIESFLSEENHSEVIEAFQSIFAQGMGAATRGFKASQQDWADQIQNAVVPIRLIAGLGSDLHHVNDINAFAARYPGKVEVLDVSDRGYATHFDMADYLIALVRAKAPV